jgi:hypothetical protein
MEGRRGAYMVLVWRPDGVRPLGRPRRRWGEKYKDGSSRSGMWGMDRIDLAQDRDRW